MQASSESSTKQSISTLSTIEQLKLYIKPPVINMLFLGFSAGLPILLIFSSLSLWLREAGISRSAVTYFSWAALGYSFKFVWAPLVDKLPVPFLSAWLGRRRSWLLVAQCAVIASIIAMAMTDPNQGQQALTAMAIAAVALGFSSATQDVVIDAYRIEVADVDLQALMSATYIAGYRIAMIAAGAGAIYLAADWGSAMDDYSYLAWQKSYLMMAALMLIGVHTTFFINEPSISKQAQSYSASDYLRFLFLFALLVLLLIQSYKGLGGIADSIKAFALDVFSNKPLASTLAESVRLLGSLAAVAVLGWLSIKINIANRVMVRDAYVEPLLDFFRRYGLKLAFLLLALIGFYRISDIVLGVISNVFYQDMGYTKKEIAGVVKTFGVVMTIIGGFIGGWFSIRYGVMKALFLGALLSALTNILFMLMPSTLSMPEVQSFAHQMPIYYPAWGITALVCLGLVLYGLHMYGRGVNKDEPNAKSLLLKTRILSFECGALLLALLVGLMLGWISSDAFSMRSSNVDFTGKLLSLGVVIGADNLSAGLASAAFIAFLSSLTNVSFTATQYAIFSSLMTLLPKIIGGYSGGMVDVLGYEQFFFMTTLMGLPVLLLVYLAGKHLQLKQS